MIRNEFKILIINLLLLVGCKNNDEIIEYVEPKISVHPEEVNMPFGSTYQLKVTLQGVPDTAKIIWTCSFDAIKVNQNGLITTVPASEARETAISTNLTARLANYGTTTSIRINIYKEYDTIYRLVLFDKRASSGAINPSTFLSPKAIERRLKRNIAIDIKDFPISTAFIDQIQNIGGKIVTQSKWLNTICVACNDSLLKEYKKLPFIKETTMVGIIEKKSVKHSTKMLAEFMNYGSSYNIALNSGKFIHDKGFRGSGIEIGVIDAGFMNVDTNPLLSNVSILGAKSFIFNKASVYDPTNKDCHGSWVLSCMATNRNDLLIGSAPEAGYWLLNTEDEEIEQPIEEDYMVAAMEFADSIGLELINTSLYYVEHFYPFPKYQYNEMDGKTAFATRGANIAAEKGILIVCCAGNHNSWVGTPTDSPNVLSVGSIYEDKSISFFTAYGFTIDGRIKPDIVTLGSGVNVVGIDGKLENRSGTSYASPIICGLIACLWQAYPQLTNKELIQIIKQASDRFSKPELPYGYGIPNMEKAMQLAEELCKNK